MPNVARRKWKIGVMGSASGPTIRDPKARRLAFELGRAIARAGCICVTGACPGLPDRAAAGARRAGGFVFGVSPAFSLREHLEIYGSPVSQYDMLLFSGMGLMERDIVNIRSADGIVVVGGGMGTLNEFTVAFEEQKPVGVLTGTGGISDHIEDILAFCRRHAPPDRLLLDSEPRRLVRRLLSVVRRFSPPVRESDIGGEKEESLRARFEARSRLQQRRHKQRVGRTTERESC